MKKVKITAVRRTEYPDLMAKYENPIEHPCEVEEGMVWVSENAEKPENFCNNAWEGIAPFVKTLAAGGGDFYDGWMKNPHSAMLSCNDGFRPMSYYLEALAFETKRLILRPWQESDAEALYEYAKDPDIGLPAGWPPHTDVENSREIIRNVLSVPETYAVCLKDDKPIGSIGLKLKDHTDMTDREDECELGYWLGKPFWGQGLIPEAARELLRYAFEILKMRAVWCGYYDGNEKSHRVQQKLGFVYHHTTENMDVSLLDEKRTGHTSLLTREQWEKEQKNSERSNLR